MQVVASLNIRLARHCEAVNLSNRAEQLVFIYRTDRLVLLGGRFGFRLFDDLFDAAGEVFVEKFIRLYRSLFAFDSSCCVSRLDSRSYGARISSSPTLPSTLSVRSYISPRFVCLSSFYGAAVIGESPFESPR